MAGLRSWRRPYCRGQRRGGQPAGSGGWVVRWWGGERRAILFTTSPPHHTTTHPFDFAAAFGTPVRVVNDAAMQALGGYDGGRMLFLGLGTGLGSALVTERVVVPLELGCLPYEPGESMAQRLGRQGLERHGKDAWQAAVSEVIVALRTAFVADYVVLGGGNVKQLD